MVYIADVQKTYAMAIGAVLVLVGLLGFVPGAKDLLASLFNINMAITVLRAGIAVVSLGVAYGVKEGAAQ